MTLVVQFCGINTVQRVSLSVLGVWSVQKREMKSGEEQSPVGLAWIQVLSYLHILEIFMVDEDCKWVN